MNKIIDKYPFKKILYLNWYEAAISHLLLFRYYVDKFSQNVYFLISEQGIILKATTADYLKRADDQITKFFTAKIQELELSGSADFYANLIGDISQQTERLKENRDCPYINLVYSEKLRNSCLAMKKHGYSKPFQNWECKQREKKGFCFLIVRPEHRWKQIANNVYQLARKRYPSHSKTPSQVVWPVQICYEKFIWFYLKQSFKEFKKNLEIKDNKADKCLTIVIKNDIPELNDLEKQIQSLTFSYRPRKPIINQPNSQNKILILSALDIEKITELVYHEFGLTSFAKELRRKMSGFLVISSVDISDHLEDMNQNLSNSQHYLLSDKEDIICLNNKRLTSVLNKMGRRHSIVSYEGTNFVQLKIDKPVKQNYEKILKLRLPCLPRYYYWYQNEKNYFLLRGYICQKFTSVYEKSKTFQQISLLYNLISIVDELHQRGIAMGSAMSDCIFIDEKRLIVEPDQNGTKEQDSYKLKKLVDDCIEQIKEQDLKHEIMGVLAEAGANPFGLIEYLQDYIDSNL